MLRLQNLANKYVRRTLRPLYAQTQAYPYDAQLSSSVVRTAATFTVGASACAIVPGVVAAKSAGESVIISGDAENAGAQEGSRPFGLFANFVGTDLTDIPSDFDRVGVWRGAGGVFELLAPAFDDTSLSTLATAEDGTAAKEVYLAAKGGVLAAANGATAGSYYTNLVTNGTVPAARLMSHLSANAIIVELLV